jgi:hypothetical protein
MAFVIDDGAVSPRLTDTRTEHVRWHSARSGFPVSSSLSNRETPCPHVGGGNTLKVHHAGTNAVPAPERTTMKIYLTFSVAVRLVFWLLFFGMIFGLALQYWAAGTDPASSELSGIARGGVHRADACDHYLADRLAAVAARLTTTNAV